MEIEKVKEEIEKLGFKILGQSKIGDKIVVDFIDKKMKEAIPHAYFASSLAYNPSTDELDATIRKLVEKDYAGAEVWFDDELVLPHLTKFDNEVVFSLTLRFKKNSLERFMDVLNSVIVHAQFR
jgi:hypothetical protein